MDWRPSRQLNDVLSGRVAISDAQAGIRSWAGYFIYQAAAIIVAESEKGERRNMLARIPAPVRPYVAAEVKRLWADR